MRRIKKEIPKADRGFVGEVFESNSCGSFRVLRRCGKDPSGNALYEVKFIDTGYQRETTKDSAKKGHVRDPYYPSLYGVACTGETKTRKGGSMKPSYKRWLRMIKRCYDESHPRYSGQGGRGISVCDRWRCFKNYEEDIRSLPNYGRKGYDTIGRVDNGGDYSPQNCRWATASMHAENARLNMRRIKKEEIETAKRKKVKDLEIGDIIVDEFGEAVRVVETMSPCTEEDCKGNFTIKIQNLQVSRWTRETCSTSADHGVILAPEEMLNE